jgi:Lrp/AsnC family leucine-responsive transcriptional regulator
MDKLDYMILSELHKDGLISFVDIAKNLNSTPCKVRRHYEKMRNDGVIYGFVATINLEKLGYEGKVFLMITLVSNVKKTETVEYLMGLRNVIGVVETIGPSDLIAIAPITDLASIQELITKTKKAPNVQKVDFYCISNVDFPMGRTFDEMLTKRCLDIASKL